ncbi:MAG: hypothetical protein EPN82_00395 [Bacteroidetes bacterium]|nr:MAG: hypothetical protein EPN82_00395 [Bacteroidota bacterium]
MKSRHLIYCIFLLFLNINLNSQNLERIAEDKIITAGGSIGLNFSYYGATGMEARYRPIDYSILGSFTINLFGISFPFSATISEQNRSFIQPFNQYGVSPKYKWITAHAGWRNLNYSPFTLSGHTFLGGGIELNPGIIRFSAMYGRFLKSTTGDSSITHNITPTFERMGYGVKMGLGAQTDYCDLIFFRASDDSNSINSKYLNHLDSESVHIKPAENMVLGLSSKFSPFSFLSFDIDGAASVYTLDTRATSLTDFDSTGILKQFKSIFNVRTSTQFTTAFQTAVTYRGRGFSLRLGYKRIDPDYKSMGIYYMESDVENITLSPYFSLFNNLLRIGGSIGIQNDNLMKTKTYTSNRIIGSIDLSHQQQSYGIDLRYSSYGIAQTRRLFPIKDSIPFVDSLKVARVNHNFNSVFRLTFANESAVHNILLVGTYQTLVDMNSRTAGNTETENVTGTVTYQSVLIKSGISYGININAVQSNMAKSKSLFIGPILQLNWNLGSFGVGGSFGYQIQKVDGKNKGVTTTATVQSSYQLTNSHSLRFDVNYINSTLKETEQFFNEYRSSIGYIYNF